MIIVFTILLFLVAGATIGPMIAGHQGYVLIQTNNWNIETSVIGLVIMLVLDMLMILAVEWILRWIFRTSVRTRGWCMGYKRRCARKQMNAALVKLTEGDYKQMEKLLLRHAAHADQPVVNYLLAAKAAQQDGDEIRANQHLQRASELNDSDPLPVEITRIRLQLTRHEDFAARRGIDRLLEIAPRHPEILRLAEQAYVRTQAWNALLDILPNMEKIRLNDKKHLFELQQQAWMGLMNQIMVDQGSEGLKRWWQNQSRKTQNEPALQAAMAEHLIVCNDHDTAQKIILDGMRRQYDERQILLIPRLKAENQIPLEKALRQQIKQHGDTPLLQSTLGQLLMQHGEWQQASEAFHAALQLRPDVFDYAWLADTLDQQHKPEEAARMRRDGLMLTLKNNPRLHINHAIA